MTEREKDHQVIKHRLQYKEKQKYSIGNKFFFFKSFVHFFKNRKILINKTAVNHEDNFNAMLGSDASHSSWHSVIPWYCGVTQWSHLQ